MCRREREEEMRRCDGLWRAGKGKRKQNTVLLLGGGKEGRVENRDV